MWRYPNSIATLEMFSILRPLKATFRLNARDASMICCMRWIFEAKVATIMRPVARSNSFMKVSPIAFSDMVYPLRSTFVLSDIKSRIPACASSEMRSKSIGWLSIGVWSTLKSPVWNRIPTGVWIAREQASAMLWVVRINSMDKWLNAMTSRGLTTWSLVFCSNPCSLILFSTKPKVSFVP